MFPIDASDHTPIEELLREMRSLWTPRPARERVPVGEACGRIAAADILSALDIPVCRAAKCDGIAVRSADFAHAVPRAAAWREGEDYAVADMGDDFDDRFDAVIPVEFAEMLSDGGVCLTPGPYDVAPGHLVEPKGGTMRKGQVLVRGGTRIASIGIANLLSGGVAQVDVVRRPVVTFVPTGSELVPPGTRPQRGQVVDCNGEMVRLLLSRWGAEARVRPIVRDVPAELAGVLDEALAESDIVLIGGGSSKGREDFAPGLIRRRAAHFRHYVKARPGRPVVTALCGGKPVVNIPGTAFSTFVPMQWCVRALIDFWYGLNEPSPAFAARMRDDLALSADYPLAYGMFFRVERERGELVAYSLDRFATRGELFMKANAYAILPIGCGGFQAGDVLTLYPID